MQTAQGIAMLKSLRAGRVFRQQPAPTVLFTITDIDDAARRLEAAISLMHWKRGCGAYLFVSPMREVYLVEDTRAWMRQALRTLDNHPWFPWFVGYYLPEGPLSPDAAGIAEDLADHLGSSQ